MEHTKIRISFKSSNQIPELMIIKEYHQNGYLTYAKVLYKEDEMCSEIVFEDKPVIITEHRIERI